MLSHNGKMVHVNNSEGIPIHHTEEGIRNFHDWFGSSKTVDKHGRPLVLYHGTDKDFDEFDPEKAGENTGTHLVPKSTFVFSDHPAVASTYAVKRIGFDNTPQYKDSGHVKPVYIKSNKMLKVDAKGDNWNNIRYKDDDVQTNDIFDEAQRRKFDSVKISNVFDSHQGKAPKSNVYAVFNPSQIKSALGNSGVFSKTSNKIQESNE